MKSAASNILKGMASVFLRQPYRPYRHEKRDIVVYFNTVGKHIKTSIYNYYDQLDEDKQKAIDKQVEETVF